MVERFSPAKRWCEEDFIDPFAPHPPPRQTLQRRLANHLYLVVQGNDGRWSLPCVERRDPESLFTTAFRGLLEHHDGKLMASIASNAPQIVFGNRSTMKEKHPLTFIFQATYLSGEMSFGGIQPAAKAFAWVTAEELGDYEYSQEELEGPGNPDPLSVLNKLSAICIPSCN